MLPADNIAVTFGLRQSMVAVPSPEGVLPLDFFVHVPLKIVSQLENRERTCQ